jgi:multidrug efflux system outer membrane protein
VPIFNTGRLKASQAYAEINKDINVAQYEGAIQRAFKEVADGLAARGTFVTQLKGQQDQVQNAREYVAIAQQRYDRGLDGYLAVLDAQRSLLDLQQQLLTSQFEQLAAEVDLFRALGGGWDASHAMLAASRKEPY